MSCTGCWMRGAVCTPKAVLFSACHENVIHIRVSEKQTPESVSRSEKPAIASGPHKVPRIWVIVADSRLARVFSKRGDEISLVARIVPQAQKGSAMTNKSVGRVASSGRNSIRHKYEPHMNKSQKEEIAFVHDVAAWLDAEAERESFDRLVLIVAPHMLGKLRKAISQDVYTRIVAEINKDLTKVSEADLRTELEKILWF